MDTGKVVDYFHIFGRTFQPFDREHCSMSIEEQNIV